MGIDFNIFFVNDSDSNTGKPRSSDDFYSDLGEYIDREDSTKYVLEDSTKYVLEDSTKYVLEDRLVPFLDDYLETQKGDLETKRGENYQKFNDVLTVLGSLELNQLEYAKYYIDSRIFQESSKDDKLQLMKVLGAINKTLEAKRVSIRETSNVLESEINKDKMIGDYFINDAVFREKRYVIGKGKREFILSLDSEAQVFFENNMENKGYIKLIFWDDYTRKNISYELKFSLINGEPKFQDINNVKLKSIQKAGRNTFKYTFKVWGGKIDLYLRAKRGKKKKYNGKKHKKGKKNWVSK